MPLKGLGLPLFCFISGMKLSVTFACLVLLLAVSAVRSRRVTESEKQKMRRGIDAGKTFVKVLKTTKKFTDVLTKLGSTIAPWMEGFTILTDFLGFFMPEDNELLNEMKKGFDEVNKRLDEIKEKISEVKEAIEWASVKVNFQKIEQNIKLLDLKLADAVAAPDAEDGQAHFIEIYKSNYDQAGSRLYLSVVKNDHVVADNIVAAGIKFTKSHRDKMEDYMRGLIALMIMSANIEVAYEKFTDQNRGMETIWKRRLSDTQESLTEVENYLVNAWKELFPDEVNEIAEKHKNGNSHTELAKRMTGFLADKYYWRYWFALVYDEVWGWGNHAVRGSQYVHFQFRRSGRNFVVASIDPSTTFNTGAARAAFHDYKCPSKIKDCRDNSAGKVLDLSPNVGVGKVVVFDKWYVGTSCSGPNRWVQGTVLLYKPTVRRKHYLYYFG